jgi:hypothetical protein
MMLHVQHAFSSCHIQAAAISEDDNCFYLPNVLLQFGSPVRKGQASSSALKATIPLPYTPSIGRQVQRICQRRAAILKREAEARAKAKAKRDRLFTHWTMGMALNRGE